MPEYRTATMTQARGPYSEGLKITDNPAARDEPLLGRYVDRGRMDAWLKGGFASTGDTKADQEAASAERRAGARVKKQRFGLPPEDYAAVQAAAETTQEQDAEPRCVWCGKTLAEHEDDRLGRPVPKMPCLGLKANFAARTEED